MTFYDATVCAGVNLHVIHVYADSEPDALQIALLHAQRFGYKVLRLVERTDYPPPKVNDPRA